MSDAERLLSQINGAVPQRIPVTVTASGIDCSCQAGDEVQVGTPGMECRYIDGDHEYSFVTLAVADHDYLGQHLFIQIAERAVPATTSFGEWRWAFYYRGGDSGWETWTLDINHDTTLPDYAAFGAYIDKELQR